MKKCPRCDSEKFWSLSTGQRRCSQCGLAGKALKTLWRLTRISSYGKGRPGEFFCLGVPAYRFRFQAPMNPETVQEWFRILREAIYAQALRELAILCGEIEMNETLFGGRVSGTRG